MGLTHELASEIRERRENVAYLPGFPLPETVRVSAEGEQVLAGARAVVWVVPSQWLREVAGQLRPVMPPGLLHICATKGLEPDTSRRMSELLTEQLGPELMGPPVALSGPNLSGEIAQGMPALSVAASQSDEAATRAQELLSSAQFRVYRNSDIIGVELSGALKNVIAIASGVSDGLGFGANARAALVTRGLAEMAPLWGVPGRAARDLRRDCGHGRPGDHLHEFG